MSSMCGKGWLFFLVILFRARKSTQKHFWPSFLSTIMIGLAHRLWLGEMMPTFNIWSVWSWTICLWLNGNLYRFCFIGEWSPVSVFAFTGWVHPKSRSVKKKISWKDQIRGKRLELHGLYLRLCSLPFTTLLWTDDILKGRV